MTNDDRELDDLFRKYRASCPDFEGTPGFMPKIWERIDNRRCFWFAFQGLARTAMTTSAALCVLLLILNFLAGPQTLPTYADALAADNSTPEQTYYAEAIRGAADAEQAPVPFH
ncbi:MAG: hypothetical protein ACR2IV_12645 [Bryobacteraceae bacterium]